MEHEKLDDFLKEWEGSFERPGWRYHFKTMAWIGVVLIFLLFSIRACNFLKENGKNGKEALDRTERAF